MAKPPPARPEPSTDTGYDTYLVPRSKTPAKNALYSLLLDQGWRFDAVYKEWHTPERDVMQARGRLQYDGDLTWAKIQPPMASEHDTHLPAPLIEFKRVGLDQWVVADGRP